MNLAVAPIRLREDDVATLPAAPIIGRLIVQSIDTVLIIDGHGTIHFANSAITALSGYAPSELVGHSLNVLLPAPIAAKHDAYIANYLQEPGVSKVLGQVREMSLQHRNGDMVPVELKASDLGAVQDTHYFGAFLADLRPRRRLEAANAALLLELEHRAATDPLTGLLNRRAFEEEANRMLARGERKPTELAVAILDLDRFKQVNDNFGHAAGDETLRAVVTTLRTRLRRADLFGRIGGEEFALLLPDTPLAQAAVLADRLRLAVAETEISVPGRAPLRITVSIGLTQWRPGEPLCDLLARADSALYQAKADGRNRVILS